MNSKVIIGFGAALLCSGMTMWILSSTEDRNPSLLNSNSGDSQLKASVQHHHSESKGRGAVTSWMRNPHGKATGRSDSDGYRNVELNPDQLAELKKANVVDVERRVQLVHSDELIAEVLKMNPQEVEHLNTMWADNLSKLHELRSQHIRHQELADGGVWVGVSVFPNKGEKLRREFIQTTESVLGEERARIFMDTIKVHGAYGQWGKTVGSAFTIRVRVQENGNHLYEIDEQARSDGSPSKKWQCSRIPAHLEDLAIAVGISLEP